MGLFSKLFAPIRQHTVRRENPKTTKPAAKRAFLQLEALESRDLLSSFSTVDQ